MCYSGNDAYKFCNKCKKWLVKDNSFYKNKKLEDGLCVYCKECMKNSRKIYRKDNLEKVKVCANQSYEKHKNKYADYYEKICREKPDFFRERLNAWAKENPQRVKIYRKNRKIKTHNISKTEWNKCKVYFNSSCAYCGITEDDAVKQFKNKLHKEHVDDKGANDLSNCVPACKRCNSKKNTRVFLEWYNKDNDIFSEDRLNKILNWINGDYNK